MAIETKELIDVQEQIDTKELKYAAEVVIPVVENVYQRFLGGKLIDLPDVQHLADIEADTRRLEEMRSLADPGTAKMVHDMFADPSAKNPLTFGAVDFDPTTSTLFIAFRGTKKGTEWLDDFEPLPAKFEEVGDPVPWVHFGFLHIFKLAKDSLDTALKNVPKFSSVIVTGHSLGAAIANLCALDLSVKPAFPVVKCWTFASPRTYLGRPKRFDTSIAESLRVHNPVDIVTNVPLPPFVHVKGGVAIKPKLQDFHSLMNTYLPGVKALAGERGASIKLEPNEADLIDSAPES